MAILEPLAKVLQAVRSSGDPYEFAELILGIGAVIEASPHISAETHEVMHKTLSRAGRDVGTLLLVDLAKEALSKW